MSDVWCRACGADLAAGTQCTSCRVTLEPWVPVEGRVGLVFEVSGLLRNKVGLCVAEEGDNLVLHFAKGSDSVVKPKKATQRSDVVDTKLSLAGRLIAAARIPETKTHQWDADSMRERAGAILAGSVPAQRQLFDEALARDWPEITSWIQLTDSEKAWRRAHSASASGDLTALDAAVRALPAAGYSRRVRLLLPHLDGIAAQPDVWSPVITAWAEAAVTGAEALLAALRGEGRAAMEGLAQLLPPERARVWNEAIRALDSTNDLAPVLVANGAWERAQTWLRGRSGDNIDDRAGQLTQLPASLVDDVIDAGAVTDGLQLEGLEGPVRAHVLGRVRPEHLSDAEVETLGHTAELARRAFLRHDVAALESLDPIPAVEHYRALDALRAGRPADTSKLRPEIAELVATMERALKEIQVDGGSRLPDMLLADPTTWERFADVARTGLLSPHREVRSTHPDFARWCDLQRLVGLLWEQNWVAAAELGRALIPSLEREAEQDEAMSLTAFALAQLGQPVEAMDLLDKAMSGAYTEALLINSSVVASYLSADLAAPHLARLVNEAPNLALRSAALRRAVDVWMASPSQEFPSSLVAPLRQVLSDTCAFDDYVVLSRVAADHAPTVMLELTEPADDRKGPYRLQVARARWKVDDSFLHSDLADAFVTSAKTFGRTPWFDREWDTLRALVRESVFVPFGEAMGSAIFIDRVIVQIPELFPRQDRMVLLGQAGGHMAFKFSKEDGWLSQEAFSKFFFSPIEEFLSERHLFDSSEVDHVAGNFHNTLSVATILYLGTTRQSLAEDYNAVVTRLRHDPNPHALLARMRTNLGESNDHCAFGDRCVDRLTRLGVDTPRANGNLADIKSMIAEWRAETVKLRANL